MWIQHECSIWHLSKSLYHIKLCRYVTRSNHPEDLSMIFVWKLIQATAKTRLYDRANASTRFCECQHRACLFPPILRRSKLALACTQSLVCRALYSSGTGTHPEVCFNCIKAQQRRTERKRTRSDLTRNHTASTSDRIKECANQGQTFTFTSLRSFL